MAAAGLGGDQRRVSAAPGPARSGLTDTAGFPRRSRLRPGGVKETREVEDRGAGELSPHFKKFLLEGVEKRVRPGHRIAIRPIYARQEMGRITWLFRDRRGDRAMVGQDN